MNTIHKILLAGSVAVMLFWANGANATPIVIGSTQYGVVGSTENVTATFTNPDGGVSTGNYSGYVELTVTGTGFSLGDTINDAFYLLPDQSNDASYYQLTFGLSPLVGLDPAQDAKNFIAYDVLADTEVSAPYVPAYEADHTYTFVINTGTVTPEALHFGVSDGVFGDNGGAYQIQISQLQAVPEPATVALVALGLFGIGAMRRRKV